MELHYEVHAGTGPYILLVHGFLTSRAQWLPNLAALACVAQPVIVELWGHGRSPAPETPMRYHPDTYVDMFEALRIRLGVEHWLVCGQSLGAALTLRYTLTYPERVKTQVFTNANSALADAEWIQTRRASALQQAEAIEQEGQAALEKIPVHPIHARRLPPEAKAALLADAKGHTPRGIANTLRYTTPNASVRDRVKDLQVPTLLVCGERERRFAPLRAFAEATIPGLQIVGTSAGHAVNIEAAAVFNDAVVAFIEHHTA